jgi:streptomycin 6-kinase
MTATTAVPAIAIPAGTRQRITTHYGEFGEEWLETVADLIQQAAAKWNVTIAGSHDRGWASVVAYGKTADDHKVIIKAVLDPRRYASELAALRHWDGVSAGRVLDADDTRQSMLLAMVGQVPGGAARPDDHQRRTAVRLPSLHRTEAEPGRANTDVATLFHIEIRPRLERSDQLAESIGPDLVRAVLDVGERLARSAARSVILHGDLYADNIVFDASGHPVFIDPRGLRGPAEFDWAFWCLYYLDTGFDERIALLDRLHVDAHAVLPWIAVLAADGLRYHLRTADIVAADRLRSIVTSEPVLRALGR